MSETKEKSGMKNFWELYLKNLTLVYVFVILMIGVVIFFVFYPTYRDVRAGWEEFEEIEEKIEKNMDQTEVYYADYKDLKTRLGDVQSEVRVALENEVLPREPQETELVRFFEMKVQEFDISDKDYMILNSIDFGGTSLVEGEDYSYLSVKISLEGSEDNFYRFIEMIERSGIRVEVRDVEESSPAYRAGIMRGDVIKGYETAEGVERVLLPWVLDEYLKQMHEGEKVTLILERYVPKTGRWEELELDYEASGVRNEVSGYIETGMDLRMSEDFSRFMNIDKISVRFSERDEEEVVGEGRDAEFNLELKAYYFNDEE